MRLPELARNAGVAARIPKSETKAMKADGAAAEEQASYRIKQPPPGERMPTHDPRDHDSGRPRA